MGVKMQDPPLLLAVSCIYHKLEAKWISLSVNYVFDA